MSKSIFKLRDFVISNFRISYWEHLVSTVSKVFYAEEVDELPEPVSGFNYLHATWAAAIKDVKSIGSFNGGSFRIEFIVGHMGDISDIQIVQGIDTSIDKQLIKVFRRLPVKWKPGKKDGHSVKVDICLDLEIIIN